MSQQIQITGGAKVRDLQDVIIGSSGVLSSLGFNVANGVPQLDSNGKILVSQLPNSVMEYKGTWNAATNTPTLANGTGNQGDVYLCNVAGTVDFGAGPISFIVGDSAVYSGSIWQRSGGATGSVTSVGLSTNGGAITISNSPITTSGTIAFNFNGTSGQYVNGAGNLTTFPSLTGYVPYTGATGNVDLGEYELKAGQLTLDVSPTGTPTVGTTLWNNTIGSSETLLKGGSVLLKNGVDLVARVVNKVTPNTTLTKATYPAVRVSGAQGQRLAVAFAQANNDNNSADTIGLVTETIATNQEGFIMTVGQLLDINTTGSLQGETWSDGDVLYLSPTTAGALTNIKPTGLTGHIVVMGYVEYAHAIHGSIYVKVMNGWELDELHNVYISSPTNNQGLFYNSSNSLWENKSIATALGYTPANDASVVHLAGTETITGSKTFSGLQSFTNTAGTDLTYGAYLTKNSIPSAFSSSTVNLYSASGNNNLVVRDNGNTSKLQFQATSSYTYTFPALTGTLALTSDISYPVTSVFGRTGAVVATEGDYSLTQLSDVTITTPSSGQVLRYNGTSWENSTESYVGTVTSVGLSAPTGFSVSGSPVTSSGTLALAFAAGYSLPTNASQTNWDTAYTNRITSATAPLSITSNVISISQATTSTSGYLSSTDWNTFNGKQATITLTTTGSSGAATLVGATLNIPNYGSALSGYLPLTGGTLTGALNINVSSGTALNVAGNAIFRGDTGVATPRQLVIQSGGSTPVYLEAKGYGANYITDFGIRTYNNVGTAFEVFYADSSGRVGINQVSPSYQLDVNGTGRFAASYTASGTVALSIWQRVGGAVSADMTYNDANTSMNFGTSTSHTLNIKTNNTTALSLSSTGAATFNATTAVGLTVNGGNSSDGTVGKFSRGGAEKNFYISCTNNQYVNLGTEGDFRFKTGVTVDQPYATGVDAMVIKSNGNILIGTITDRSFKLVVEGTDNNNLMGSYNTTSGASLRMQSNQTVNYIVSATNQLQFEVGAAIRMAITTGGNVLIGTTTDSGHKLRVFGDGASFGNGGDFYQTINSGASGSYYLIVNGAIRQTIASTGAATFSSSVTVNSDLISLAYRGTTAYNYYDLNGAGAHRFRDNNGNNILMSILNSGNVGIGTTSPNSTLEVYGTSQASPNTSNAIFKVNGSATNAIVMGTLSGSPFATYIQSGGSGTYPLSLNPNGGNVLIGTTTDAGGKLTIGGSGDATLFLNGATGAGGVIKYLYNSVQQWYVGTNAAGGGEQSYNIYGYTANDINFVTNSALRLKIASNGTTTLSGTFVQSPSSGSGGFYIDRGTSSGSPYISWLNGSGTRLGYMGYSNTNIGLYLENSANFTVTGGNVLIGTTSDNGYKLYVDGGSSNGMAFYSTSPGNQFKIAGSAAAMTFSNTISGPSMGGSLGVATSAGDFLSGTAAGDTIFINQFSGKRLYAVSYSGGVYLSSGATSWTANSDIRLKNINSYIENAVEKLSTLQTINFSYKDDKTNKQNLGLIAQEVEKIFPELIDKNGDGMLGVRYTELVPVLIKAVQELKLEIETLKNK